MAGRATGHQFQPGITWYLSVVVSEFRSCLDGDFAGHLLRAMLVDYLGAIAASYPNGSFTLKRLIDEGHLEAGEQNYFYSINHTELFADFERFNNCEVVRINHLGEYEDNNDWISEMSIYVIGRVTV